MPGCECNLAGLISTNYSGIVSANLNGSTTVELAEDGTVLIGQTTNTLSITAYPFSPGGDMFLGVRCPSQASVSLDWVSKYDCIDDIVYFIPAVGGKTTMSGDNINGVSLICDPNITNEFMDASASGGPTTPVIISSRKDGYGLRYSGVPISIDTINTTTYYLVIGSSSFNCYLQSFSINVRPPSPAQVSYSFVFSA